MTTASKRKSGSEGPGTKSRRSAAAPGLKPRETKRAQLIGMLKVPKGAEVAQISRRLGWLPHTTRAALTGLRKAGFTIERITSDGGGASCYRITAEPAPTPAA